MTTWTSTLAPIPRDATTLERITDAVCAYWHTTREEIHGRSRVQEIVLPRFCAMWLAVKLTDLSLASIGKFYGGRDHTTVINARRSLQDRIDTEPAIKKAVMEILGSIASAHIVYRYGG